MHILVNESLCAAHMLQSHRKYRLDDESHAINVLLPREQHQCHDDAHHV